jgi:hypothetical protein
MLIVLGLLSDKAVANAEANGADLEANLRWEAAHADTEKQGK